MSAKADSGSKGSPLVVLQNLFDFLQVVVVLVVQVEALVRNQLAFLEQLLEVGARGVGLVADVIAEFTLALEEDKKKLKLVQKIKLPNPHSRDRCSQTSRISDRRGPAS